MFRLIILLSCLGFISTNVCGENIHRPGELVQQYHNLIKSNKIATNLALISSYKNDRLSANIVGKIEHPFYRMQGFLKNIPNLCDFMLLNLNIKTCIATHKNDIAELVLFAGRKFYQHPRDGERIVYKVKINSMLESYVDISLTAAEGPYGTSEYVIRVQAEPDKNMTILHIHTGYTTSIMSRLGTGIYLSTMGSDKIGFSITGYNKKHEPIYIQGEDGVIERNAMRYYLGFLAMLEPEADAGEKQFLRRAEKWFELTQQYKKQLYEMEKQEYLGAKKQEYANQRLLQQRVDKDKSIESVLEDVGD